MGEPELKRMTADEFLVWQQDQNRNYELVDGLPILPLKGMTGATHAHDRATVALLREFATQLRRKRCQPATQDIAVKIPRGNVRRPDVLVECGPVDMKTTWTAEPKLVAEVLSPSTINVDRFRKVEEYKTVPSIAYVLLVDTEQRRLTLHVREGVGWRTEFHDATDAVIDLPEIECRLAAADVFENLPPVTQGG
jgi:Uma2 family endonuclease